MRRSSAYGALFGQAVATAAGISGSDLECLDLLHFEGRVPAGRLAEVTGLTTGGITGVVNRLEKAGYVRRERDKTDRRKVLITIIPETTSTIGRFYEPMRQAMHKLWGSYSEAELRLLLRFANEGCKVVMEATETLKGMISTAPEEFTKLKSARRFGVD